MPDRPITAADTGPAGSRTVLGHPWQVLAAISAGGVLGALARAALGERFGTPRGGFAWTTFAINVSGCLLIGALMVLVTRSRNGSRNGSRNRRRLLRPFLGVGVLGGFTTFSGYVVDTERTLAAGAIAPALGYLLATPVAAVLAAYLGARFTRWAISPGPSPAAGR